MNVPRKPKPRRNETQELTRPIEAALNKLPGVRVRRNNTGVLEDKRGVPVRYGLGVGSADLVGICEVQSVSVPASLEALGRVANGQVGALYPTRILGRAFCLEVKRPGEKPTADQVRWLESVRRLGGFAAIVHSVEEALACVERCRAGQSQ